MPRHLLRFAGWAHARAFPQFARESFEATFSAVSLHDACTLPVERPAERARRRTPSSTVCQEASAKVPVAPTVVNAAAQVAGRFQTDVVAAKTR
jgi:hypothetical protein